MTLIVTFDECFVAGLALLVGRKIPARSPAPRSVRSPTVHLRLRRMYFLLTGRDAQAARGLSPPTASVLQPSSSAVARPRTAADRNRPPSISSGSLWLRQRERVD